MPAMHKCSLKLWSSKIDYEMAHDLEQLMTEWQVGISMVRERAHARGGENPEKNHQTLERGSLESFLETCHQTSSERRVEVDWVKIGKWNLSEATALKGLGISNGLVGSLPVADALGERAAKGPRTPGNRLGLALPLPSFVSLNKVSISSVFNFLTCKMGINNRPVPKR